MDFNRNVATTNTTVAYRDFSFFATSAVKNQAIDKHTKTTSSLMQSTSSMSDPDDAAITGTIGGFGTAFGNAFRAYSGAPPIQ